MCGSRRAHSLGCKFLANRIRGDNCVAAFVGINPEYHDMVSFINRCEVARTGRWAYPSQDVFRLFSSHIGRITFVPRAANRPEATTARVLLSEPPEQRNHDTGVLRQVLKDPERILDTSAQGMVA